MIDSSLRVPRTREQVPTDLEAHPHAWAECRLREYLMGVRERRTQAELLAAIEEEEARMGRAFSSRERFAFTAGFFDPGY